MCSTSSTELQLLSLQSFLEIFFRRPYNISRRITELHASELDSSSVHLVPSTHFSPINSERNILEDDQQQEDLPLASRRKPLQKFLKIFASFFRKLTATEKQFYQQNIKFSVFWRKKTTPFNKADLFNFIMKSSTNIDEDSGSKHSQYGCASVLMKNGQYRSFPIVFPCDPDEANDASSSTEGMLHCEEILIKTLDKFLKRNGTEAQIILIYTYNSPCLERGKNEPCMCLLLKKSYEWHKNYKIGTYVLFTKCWGISGPDFFNNLTYSEISCPKSVFNSYFIKSDTIPYKMNCSQKKFEKIYKPRKIYDSLLGVKNEDREELRGKIRSALQTLKSENPLCFTQKEHLDHGQKMISSFTFKPQVQNQICKILSIIWQEIVEDTFVSLVTEKITDDFNRAVVQYFQKQHKLILGNSSPFQLHHIPMLDGFSLSKDLRYSEISSPSSVFNPYFNKCEEVPFNMNFTRKKIRKIRNIYEDKIKKMLRHVNDKDKEELWKKIRSALNTLETENPFFLRKEHLDHGHKIIASFAFNLQVQNQIREYWQEMVEHSFVSLVKEKIEADFNPAVVQHFQKQLQLPPYAEWTS